MCGRFLNKLPGAEIARIFGTRNALPNYPARFNIAPTDPVFVVRFNQKTNERSLDALRWPRSALGKRPEIRRTLHQCPRGDGADHASVSRCFREPALHHSGERVLRMEKERHTKMPYAIVPSDAPLFAFAGLWENWRDKAAGDGAEWIRTCAIITGPPNELVSPIHDRMPVILPQEAWARWLGEEEADRDELHRC
jgi:putative SOS response-associated peptidase YedK